MEQMLPFERGSYPNPCNTMLFGAGLSIGLSMSNKSYVHIPSLDVVICIEYDPAFGTYGIIFLSTFLNRMGATPIHIIISIKSFANGIHTSVISASDNLISLHCFLPEHICIPFSKTLFNIKFLHMKISPLPTNR